MVSGNLPPNRPTAQPQIVRAREPSRFVETEPTGQEAEQPRLQVQHHTSPCFLATTAQRQSSHAGETILVNVLIYWRGTWQDTTCGLQAARTPPWCYIFPSAYHSTLVHSTLHSVHTTQHHISEFIDGTKFRLLCPLPSQPWKLAPIKATLPWVLPSCHKYLPLSMETVAGSQSLSWQTLGLQHRSIMASRSPFTAVLQT